MKKKRELKRKTKAQHSQHHFVVFNIYMAVNIKQFFFGESRFYVWVCVFACVFLFSPQNSQTALFFSLSFSHVSIVQFVYQPMCLLCTTFFIAFRVCSNHFFCCFFSSYTVCCYCCCLLTLLFGWLSVWFMSFSQPSCYRLRNCVGWVYVSRFLKIHKHEVPCNSWWIW